MADEDKEKSKNEVVRMASSALRLAELNEEKCAERKVIVQREKPTIPKRPSSRPASVEKQAVHLGNGAKSDNKMRVASKRYKGVSIFTPFNNTNCALAKTSDGPKEPPSQVSFTEVNRAASVGTLSETKQQLGHKPNQPTKRPRIGESKSGLPKVVKYDETPARHERQQAVTTTETEFVACPTPRAVPGLRSAREFECESQLKAPVLEETCKPPCVESFTSGYSEDLQFCFENRPMFDQNSEDSYFKGESFNLFGGDFIDLVDRGTVESSYIGSREKEQELDFFRAPRPGLYF